MQSVHKKQFKVKKKKKKQEKRRREENGKEGEVHHKNPGIYNIHCSDYAWVDLAELRMRWNPEKNMMKKVTSTLMKAG